MGEEQSRFILGRKCDSLSEFYFSEAADSSSQVSMLAPVLGISLLFNLIILLALILAYTSQQSDDSKLRREVRVKKSVSCPSVKNNLIYSRRRSCNIGLSNHVAIVAVTNVINDFSTFSCWNHKMIFIVNQNS